MTTVYVLEKGFVDVGSYFVYVYMTNLSGGNYEKIFTSLPSLLLFPINSSARVSKLEMGASKTTGKFP